jgi:drug/metabolite transporter (DMT)-like permease
MGLESFPPFVLVSTRYMLSGAILVGVALARGARLPRGKELAHSALSGALILAVGNGCLTFAELQIPGGLAGLFHHALTFLAGWH